MGQKASLVHADGGRGFWQVFQVLCGVFSPFDEINSSAGSDTIRQHILVFCKYKGNIAPNFSQTFYQPTENLQHYTLQRVKNAHLRSDPAVSLQNCAEKG